MLTPAIAGVAGVLVMILFLRRARYLHLPETQMIRAIGSAVTKDAGNALWPGFAIHLVMGILFSYGYMLLLRTAPVEGVLSLRGHLIVYGVMGTVHGLIVTLILVITVVQYHPLEEFRKMEPGDMASHVIAHIAYGVTLGVVMALMS